VIRGGKGKQTRNSLWARKGRHENSWGGTTSPRESRCWSRRERVRGGGILQRTSGTREKKRGKGSIKTRSFHTGENRKKSQTNRGGKKDKTQPINNEQRGGHFPDKSNTVKLLGKKRGGKEKPPTTAGHQGKDSLKSKKQRGEKSCKSPEKNCPQTRLKKRETTEGEPMGASGDGCIGGGG